MDRPLAGRRRPPLRENDAPARPRAHRRRSRRPASIASPICRCEHDPLGERQVGVERLAHQGVTEAVASGSSLVGDDQAAVERLVEQRDDVAVREDRQAPQEGQREVATDRRRRPAGPRGRRPIVAVRGVRSARGCRRGCRRGPRPCSPRGDAPSRPGKTDAPSVSRWRRGRESARSVVAERRGDVALDVGRREPAERHRLAVTQQLGERCRERVRPAGPRRRDTVASTQERCRPRVTHQKLQQDDATAGRPNAGPRGRGRADACRRRRRAASSPRRRAGSARAPDRARVARAFRGDDLRGPRARCWICRSAAGAAPTRELAQDLDPGPERGRAVTFPAAPPVDDGTCSPRPRPRTPRRAGSCRCPGRPSRRRAPPGRDDSAGTSSSLRRPTNGRRDGRRGSVAPGCGIGMVGEEPFPYGRATGALPGL